MARDVIVLEIGIKQWKIPKGHKTYRGGAGKHADRRTKWNRTRTNKNRNAIKESM